MGNYLSTYLSNYIKNIIYPGKHSSCDLDYNQLYRIPRKEPENVEDNIPIEKQISFIFLKNQDLGEDCKNLVIYFHGNSENACDPMEKLKKINRELKTHSCIVEYSGYGIFHKKTEISPKLIEKDSKVVFDFLTKEVGFKDENIMIIGRSIGTGPAMYLASKRQKIKMLTLISPFTSVLQLVKDKYWFYSEDFFNILTKKIKDDFKNIDLIEQVKCPILMIHGKKDWVINIKHSIELAKKPNEIMV